MKLIGNTGSIKKNTNRLISTSFSDWSSVRDGTFIKFDGDSHFYTASHTEKRTFLKDYFVLQPSILQIKEDCGVNINEGDTLNISFKEYELVSLYKIISSGKGYRVGDHITIGEGTASLSIVDHTLNSTVLEISKIGAEGEIVEVNIINRGKYIDPPNNVVSLKGGIGSGASAEVSYKLADHRTFIERDVQSIEFKEGATLIYLIYPLPSGIKEGKLSIEKWEIILTTPLKGENKINHSFQITRDFTPNYGFPLIAKNALNQEMFINHILGVLDQRIAGLEERIKDLENKNKN